MPLKPLPKLTEDEYWSNMFAPDEPIATVPAAPVEEQSGNFVRGLNAGIDQGQAMAGGLKALAGAALDNDEWVTSGMEYYNQQIAESQEYAGDVMSYEDVDSASAAGAYIAYTLGTVTPDLAFGLATGGLAGLVGKAAAKKGVMGLSEKMAEKWRDGLLKEGVENDAARIIANQAAERLAQTKAAQVGFTSAQVGTAGYEGLQIAGGQFAQTLEETGVEAPLAAIGVGLVNGSLNMLPSMAFFKGMFPDKAFGDMTDHVAGKIVDLPSWKVAALNDVSKTLGYSAGVETIQFIVGEEVKSYVSNNYSENEQREYFDYLENSQKQSGLINNFLAGTITGVPFSVATVGGKAVTGQYGQSRDEGFDGARDITPNSTGFGTAADELRTATITDPDRQQQILRIFERHESADRDGTQPLSVDIDDSFLDNNPPLTDSQRASEGLSPVDDLTDYTVTESGDMAAPATLVDTSSTPVEVQAGREVRVGKGGYGDLHVFEQQLSDAKTPLADQLVGLSVAAGRPDAIDPENTEVVVEAFDQDDVNRIFDRNEDLIYKPNQNTQTTLPTISESFGEDGPAATSTVGGVLADLSLNGVPKSFVDTVSGVFVHTDNDVDAPAFTSRRMRGISINKDLISQSGESSDSLNELAYNLAHEVYHSADFAKGLSVGNPDFSITIQDDADSPRADMGSIMDELFDNWEQETEIGKRFDYPFNDLRAEISSPEIDNRRLEVVYREEAFAQLGAIFHSNPTLLKEQAPLAYTYIKQIRDSNLQNASGVEQNNVNKGNQSKAAATQSGGIPTEIRTSPIAGSKSDAPAGGARQDGEDSAGEGGADNAVEGSTSDDTGQQQRPAISALGTTPERTAVVPNLVSLKQIEGQLSERTEVVLNLDNKKPTFKKAENYEDTGEYVVTFKDGDRYTLYFDDDARKDGDEVYYTSIDGKIPALDGMLGTTKKETIDDLLSHRKQLLDAGKNSYNVPLNPEVGTETRSAAFDAVVDSDTGTFKVPALRKKFKRLEDNQFDQLIKVLTDPDLDSEDLMVVQDGVISHPETVQQIEEERLAAERLDDLDDLANDASYIKRSDLSGEAQDITVSGILYEGEKFTVPAGLTGQVTIKDIGAAMDARTKAATGGKSLDAETSENKEIISDLIAHEALEAMQRSGNAGEWYQETVRKAMVIAGEVFPELNADPDARAAFISIVAVTSNGSSVSENSQMSFPLYDYFKQNGKFQIFGAGKESQGMQKGFEQLNLLIDELGLTGMRDFLSSTFKAGDLNRIGFKTSGENADTDVFGSYILGPKIGQGFYQNLSGNFDPLTMDRWYMRTWGRLTGTMMRESNRKLPEKINNFRKIVLANKAKVKADGFDITDLRTNDETLLRYGTKVYGQFAKGDFKEKTKINEMARQLKDAQQPREAPQNGGERQWIRTVMGDALVKVNGNTASPINMGALQAIVWYPEKELFKKLGVSNKKSEPTDYETEFKQVAITRGLSANSIDRSIRASQQSGAGAAQSRDVVDDDRADENRRAGSQEVNGRSKLVQKFVKQRAYKQLRSPKSSKGKGGRVEVAIPERFRPRPRKPTKLLLDGEKVSGYKRTLQPAAKAGLALAESYNGPIFELSSTPDNAALFRAKMQAATNANPHGAAVTVYSEKDYQDMKMFIVEDGSAGIALQDGDTVVSLFSNRTHKNVTYSLFSLAIEEGGIYADLFDTTLPHIYQDLGFKTVSRVKWDDNYAPDNWDKSAFQMFNNGEPDLLFMRHDPEYFGTYAESDGRDVKDYDKGMQSMRSIADLDFDFPITHRGPEKVTSISDDGVFSGIFGSAGETSRGGYGDVETTFYPRKGRVAGDGDRDLDYEKTIKFLQNEFPDADAELIQNIYEITADDSNVFNMKVNPLAEYGFTDLGDASWEAQKIRGKIAADQGFDAIAMSDETGTSYLIPYGSKASPKTNRPEQERISPTLKQAVQDRIDRKITATQLNNIFQQEGRYVNPMHPDMIAPLKSDSHYINALKKTSREKPNTPSKETYWLSDALADGQRTGSRLDIPAHSHKTLSKDERADVVTAHAARPRKNGAPFAGAAGKRLGYYPTMRLRNALFASPQKGATNIALGADKNTIATIEGDYVAVDHEQNRLDFIAAMDDPAWTQVSMNPERHTFFYDLATQTPVVSASEIIQIGNLVIAKDVDLDDVENYAYIKKKQIGKETNTLDDGTPSTNQFTYNDEAQLQGWMYSKYRDNPAYSALVDKYKLLHDFEMQAAQYLGTGRLSAETSPRDQENLMHGKVKEDLAKFDKKFFQPISDLMVKYDVSADAVGTYLLAKHAPERNAVIAQRELDARAKREAQIQAMIESLENDPSDVNHDKALATQYSELDKQQKLPLEFQETGSGITDSQAQSVITLAQQEGMYEKMEEIASMVMDMMQFQRDVMVKSGLLDDETAGDWLETYKFYVPLKGFAAELMDNGTMKAGSRTKGFSIVGGESMKAKGRLSMPVNPLLKSIEDVQNKIVRARKNETALVILDLLSALGKSDSYAIYSPHSKNRPRKRGSTEPQDLEDMKRETRRDGSLRYIQVKKDGQLRLVYFASDTLNASMQNLNAANFQLSGEYAQKLFTFATKFQNFRRNMLINYNPTWGLVNPLRDIQTAMLYITAEADKDGSRTLGQDLAGKAFKGWRKSLTAYYRAVRGTDANAKTSQAKEYLQYAKEFIDDGAPTGLTLTKSDAELLKEIQNKFDRSAVKDTLKAIAQWVEHANQTTENAVRLSGYIEARKAGATRAVAATFAKDMTVNFDRKGDQTALVNSAYLFFNAALQGNENFIQAMGAGKADPKTGKRKQFTKARAYASSLIAMGAGVAFLNIATSDEDDDGEAKYNDFAEHTLNRSLTIIGPDGSGLAIPMSYGYNLFTNIGRYSVELAMGVRSMPEIAINLWDNILLNFVPVTPSAGDNIWEQSRGFLPDMAEPFADLAVNKNFFGSDIAINQNELFVQKSTAYSSRRSTNEVFKHTAQFLNDATGGSEFRSGAVDMSADRIDYLLAYFMGGVGRFFGDSSDVVGKMLLDKEIRKTDMPILSTFFKEPSEYADQFEFYTNRDYLESVFAELKQATGNEQFRLATKFASFAPLMGSKDSQNMTLKKANSQLKRLSSAAKVAEKNTNVIMREDLLDRIRTRQQLVFDEFNKAYRKAKKGEK